VFIQDELYDDIEKGEECGADQLGPVRGILINPWASGERIRNKRSSAYLGAREGGRWEGTET